MVLPIAESIEAGLETGSMFRTTLWKPGNRTAEVVQGDDGTIFEIGSESVCVKRAFNENGRAGRYTLEVPFQLSSDVAILLVGGLSGIEDAYTKERHRLVTEGHRAAMTLEVKRCLPIQVAAHPHHLLRPSRLHGQNALLAMRDALHFGFNKFDVVVHSKAGLDIIGAAIRHPELFRSITFEAAAGLDRPNPIEMTRRLKRLVGSEILPNLGNFYSEMDVAQAAKDLAYYWLRDPVRSVGEALEVSRCDIKPGVSRLGALGIKTILYQFEDDSLFHLDQVERAAAAITNLADFRVSALRRAGHTSPQLQSEGVAEEQLDILEHVAA